jgi:hypothetical protein
MLVQMLAPLMRSWRRRASGDWDSLPRPTDAPSAYASGDDPDRVLLFGSGPAVGWGVRTHDLALPGRLARRLAQLTGRGCDVDLVASPIFRISDAAAALRDARLWRYDVIAITWGLEDALTLTPVAEWKRTMAGLLEFLASSAPTASIVVAGIQPARSVPLFNSRWGSVAEWHAHRLNEVTRALCQRLPRVSYVAPPSVAPSAERTVAPESYELWAGALADAVMATRGDVIPTDTPSARDLRDAPQDETERQAAVDSLHLGDDDEDQALARIVALARSLFGTRFAAVSVLDGDRQVNKARAGFDIAGWDRSSSFCDRTIRGDSAFVVEDADADPDMGATLGGGFPEHVRFYAGYPLESPDGFRIGAICVFDPETRAAGSVDTSLLRDLAKLVQRELAKPRRTPGVSPYPLPSRI